MQTTPQRRDLRAAPSSSERPSDERLAPPGVMPFDDLSVQAICLHALGLSIATSTGRDGVIGRTEAERLAEECGALVDELVDAGLWSETDLSYVIRMTPVAGAPTPQPPTVLPMEPALDLEPD